MVFLEVFPYVYHSQGMNYCCCYQSNVCGCGYQDLWCISPANWKAFNSLIYPDNKSSRKIIDKNKPRYVQATLDVCKAGRVGKDCSCFHMASRETGGHDRKFNPKFLLVRGSALSFSSSHDVHARYVNLLPSCSRQANAFYCPLVAAETFSIIFWLHVASPRIIINPCTVPPGDILYR